MPFRIAIFTDLDGTLLDRETFLPGRAKEGLRRCKDLGIPVVPVSGKTRAEMEEIRRELELDTPFISENGGGLYIPSGYFPKQEGTLKDVCYWKICAAETIEELRESLKEAASTIGANIRSFGDMSAGEISKITGLDLRRAELARLREFDEPFIIVDETPEMVVRLREEIERRGRRYNFGGSLHHITGNFDKGERVRELKGIYSRHNPGIKFAAVGDAYNDLPMLKLADNPFLVRRKNGSYDTELIFDNLTVLDKDGPDGFVQAVEIMLERKRNELL